ncbi:MAG: DUF924 family protein [Sulfuricaulis sp.]
MRFWFGAGADEVGIIREMSGLWWKKDTRADEQIRRRFEPTLEAELREELVSWDELPGGTLARILLCDQFPRNMYRDSARAFAHDERARRLAHALLNQKNDRSLRPIECVFAYLPFEHSEDTQDQGTSIRLFAALYARAADGVRDNYRNYLDFAVRHQEIIDRFGRFPHRNNILGRDSTPAEREFLKSPGSSF